MWKAYSLDWLNDRTPRGDCCSQDIARRNHSYRSARQRGRGGGVVWLAFLEPVTRKHCERLFNYGGEEEPFPASCCRVLSCSISTGNPTGMFGSLTAGWGIETHRLGEGMSEQNSISRDCCDEGHSSWAGSFLTWKCWGIGGKQEEGRGMGREGTFVAVPVVATSCLFFPFVPDGCK